MATKLQLMEKRVEKALVSFPSVKKVAENQLKRTSKILFFKAKKCCTFLATNKNDALQENWECSVHGSHICSTCKVKCHKRCQDKKLTYRGFKEFWCKCYLNHDVLGDPILDEEPQSDKIAIPKTATDYVSINNNFFPLPIGILQHFSFSLLKKTKSRYFEENSFST